MKTTLLKLLGPATPPPLLDFFECNTTYAKDQPEYLPLPCFKHPNDPEGRLTFCWQMDWRNRLRVLLTGRLWHQVLTFKQPLQPQLLLTEKPVLK